MLLVAEGRGLAGGADGDEAMHAAGDLSLDKGREGLFVDGAVAKRGDQRRKNAVKKLLSHEKRKMPCFQACKVAAPFAADNMAASAPAATALVGGPHGE